MKKHSRTRFDLSRRDVLRTIGGTAAGGLLLSSGAAVFGGTAAADDKKFAGKTLNIHYWSGPTGRAVQKYITDPFIEETGATVVVSYGFTSGGIAKLRAQKADPQLDVVLFDDIGVVTTGPEDLLTKLDFDAIPNARDVDPKFVIADGLGIGFFTYSVPLIYNSDYFTTPPASWEAMWDPAMRGQVAVPTSESADAFKLIILAAILNGGSQANIEPAWEKLAALRPNVHSFVTDFPTTAELLRSGEIKLTAVSSSDFKEQQEKGYPIAVNYDVKEGFFSTPSCAVIPKNHPGDQELAELYVNKCLDPQVQAAMAAEMYFGPTNTKTVIEDPEALRYIPTADKYANLIPLDLAALQQHRQDWLTRYDQILKG